MAFVIKAFSKKKKDIWRTLYFYDIPDRLYQSSIQQMLKQKQELREPISNMKTYLSKQI